MKFEREWAMPSADTFSIKPIREFVWRYLTQSKISCDPFARNFQGATYTNDLNPNTLAKFHMEAIDFLKMLVTDNVKVDLAIFDPPYSPRQVKEVYGKIGKHFGIKDQQNTGRWTEERRMIATLKPDVCLSFGWNSQGLGKQNGFEPVEIMIVCHGGAHNDTICVAERHVAQQDLGISTPSPA